MVVSQKCQERSALDRLIAELEEELLEIEEKRNALGAPDDAEAVKLRQTIYVLRSRRFRQTQ